MPIDGCKHRLVRGGNSDRVYPEGGVRKVDFPLRSIQLSALADLDAVTMMPGLPLAESLIGHVGIDNGLVTFDVDSALVGGLDISEGLVQVGKRDTIRMLTAQATIDGTLPVAVEQVAGIPYVPERVARSYEILRSMVEFAVISISRYPLRAHRRSLPSPRG